MTEVACNGAESTEQQLRMTRFTVDHVADAIFWIDEHARFLDVNDSACAQLGYSRAELLGMRVGDIDPEFPMDRWPAHWAEMKVAGSLTFDTVHRRKDGSQYPVEVTATHVEFSGLSLNCAIARETSERKEAERERLVRLRFVEDLDRINRAIHGATDLEQMMTDTLEAVLEIFDCDRAFLMYPCDPAASDWHVPMQRTKPGYPDLTARDPVAMDAEVAGTLRTLLASAGPVRFGPGTGRPLPSALVERFSIRSSLSMVLRPKVGPPWQLGIHECAFERVWTPDDVRLFEEIGRRMADGLTSLLILRDLRKSETNYRTLFEESFDGLFVTSADGRILDMNKKGIALFGYSTKEEILELDLVRDVYTEPLDRQRILAMVAAHGTAEYDVVVKRKDGSRMTGHCSLTAVRDSHGTTQTYRGILRDVTEQRRREEALRKLSRAVEQSPVTVLITDRAGNIEYVNPRFTQITGYEPSEVLGENPRILKSGRTSLEHYRAMWETIASGREWHGELCNRKKSGTEYWVRAAISPIFDPDGAITHFVAFQEDVTRERQLEEEFRQAQKMEAIGRLAGGVAHDFNNLLSVILAYAGSAADAVPLGSSARDDIIEIAAAAGRAGALTRQLLTFSRKQVLQPEPLSVNQVAEGIRKMLQRILGEDIEYHQALAPELGLILADRGQIEQVLMNLVVNARDAMPKGGTLTIETSNVDVDVEQAARHVGIKPGPYILLAITDTGCGMDATTKARIFEPFFTTKEHGRGTGIGLSTVHGIVEQSGGGVWVRSELGRGTSFRIYLPRIEARGASAKPVTATSPRAPSHATILVVEDEEALRKVAVRALKAAGYTVIAAADGEEALRICERSGEIDLLVTDVVMPRMGGHDVSERLRKVRPGLGVLYVSGYADDTIAEHGVLAPDTHFLAKPFTATDLIRKVGEVLEAVATEQRARVVDEEPTHRYS